MAHPDVPSPAEDFSRAVEPVREWAEAVSGLAVVHDFDETHDGTGAVVLRPLAFALKPASGPVRHHVSSAELTLDLLVTTIGLPVFDAAGITSALALAASADGEWTMDASPPGVDLWRALDRPPVPAFTLQVPVRRLIERPPTPLVREPLHVVTTRPRIVVGRVVAPDGRPLGAARVALADAGSAAVVSDHRGRFRLPVATALDAPLTLRLEARGASVTLAVDAPGGGDLGDLTLPLPEPSSTR